LVHSEQRTKDKFDKSVHAGQPRSGRHETQRSAS
jgi:hypothetical protein